MAKFGKLAKLKSAIKRWPSFPKLTRSSSSASVSPSAVAAAGTNTNNDGKDLRPVYVGRSRRRYLVNPDIVDHPVFQELVDRSSGGPDSGPSPDMGVVIACEVVLFEHLLWMLESAESTQLGSMDELVEFYACA
ncbi:auxin-responsive protein SAUR50 [Senna tora]|uniref:Auxin-responsive protein SAUR50 n=1 Tax=Senna tora TaxID=362788 RepID=A0A835CIK7_9FABA|nr:auxin-responsive protein SAUR50 [Senna tora]